MSRLAISTGFSDAERAHVARLYWQAFGPKLGRVLGPEHRAMAFVTKALDPEFAITARAPEGALLGLAGFKTDEGGLVEGSLRDMARVYGWFGAIWRGLLLSTLERGVQDGIFQMDGIFVDRDARGQGVGSMLLQAVYERAQSDGAAAVHLDVINTNPRAKALYERVGFQVVKVEHTGPLKWVFGFDSAERMVRPVVSVHR